MENRVYCLYRVSTGKQVDYNESNEADIPMQRRECHRFAEEHGWTIIHEEQEDGVSGHKVRAENRDKLQIIKEHARQGKFDILLVFMFDRIGRIADETPFVVEWFVRNGIRVWNCKEGEQRFESHTDKLTNYIRFWQADGESEKTSIRTKTALRQLVEDGRFRGGIAPYGYDLVKSGRLNKRKHEVWKLTINETEAAVVRMIFDKYVNESYGTHRIATWLDSQGYRARTGKPWHPASIRNILCNLTYTGILRNGESRSPVQEDLRIIVPKQYEAAQRIRSSRASSAAPGSSHAPWNKSSCLLSGNIFCGHCGARLTLTTNGKLCPCKANPDRIVKRTRYVCYGKTRKQTKCDGQTGYTAHILDGIVDEIVCSLFSKILMTPKSEIVNDCYLKKMQEHKALMDVTSQAHEKALADLSTLKAEVVKSIRGESAFDAAMLNDMIRDTEAKCAELLALYESAKTSYAEGQNVMESLNAQYGDLCAWSKSYGAASIEAKRMILHCLIKRIEVFRGYRVYIDFNYDFGQFRSGLDLLTKPKMSA